MNRPLNVVYIGSPTFPEGYAMSKRWRYMVDYMNLQNITSHVLVTKHNQSIYDNPLKGIYGLCEYTDISGLCSSKSYRQYINKGKELLKQWFIKEKKNILVTISTAQIFTYPFLLYAKRLGYSIVFDVVETSMKYDGSQTLKRKINVAISDYLTHKVRKGASSFTISCNLEMELRNKYPKMKICILPNSTPIYVEKGRTQFNSPMRILYSGTYAPKDGVSFLIDGVIKAYDKGVDIKLILLGKGVSNDMKVLDRINGLEYIDYQGFLPDEKLLQTMKDCDVLCMTRTNSRFSNFGFPFKLSEYLATGNVLLATKVGDVSKYLIHNHDAYLIEPENSDAIAEMLMHIYENKDEALMVAANGLNTVRREFGIETVGQKFINFLKEI